MSKPNPISLSAALPIAYVALRTLIILNWLYGAAILALLVVSIANEAWFMSAFKLSASPDAERVLMGLRGIAVLGFAAVPLHYAVLKRWVLIGLNILSIVIGAIAFSVSTKAYPVRMAGFSISGWLAVLLTFVLARVFAEGAVMREDLEGTV